MTIKLHITFIATICILVFVCAAHAQDIVEVTSLHGVSLHSWQKANFDSKMATATDWVRASVNVVSVDELKEKAFGLVTYLDKSADKNSKRYAKQTKAFNEAIIGMADCEYAFKR